MNTSTTRRFLLSAAALAAMASFAPVAQAAFQDHGHQHADDHAEYIGDPYPLATDPVTGEQLTDDAVVHVHEGRQLRFNSEKNVETFMADPAKYLADVDAKLVEMQKPHYPLTTCPVSGGELGSMGEPKDIIVGNRLVRLCCAGCVAKANEDAEAVIAKLDAAVIEQQSADYPLQTCPVSGDKLGGDMGEPVNLVVANRLVKLCCAGCVDAVKQDPAAALAELDAAEQPAAEAGDHAGHDH